MLVPVQGEVEVLEHPDFALATRRIVLNGDPVRMPTREFDVYWVPGAHGRNPRVSRLVNAEVVGPALALPRHNRALTESLLLGLVSKLVAAEH